MIPISWSKQVQEVLKPALGSDKALVREQVKTGRARLFFVGGLYVVARREDNTLVYVAVAGRGLRRSVPALYDYAVSVGATKVRFHTKKPELLLPKLSGLRVRLIERKSRLFSKDEFIYEVML